MRERRTTAQDAAMPSATTPAEHTMCNTRAMTPPPASPPSHPPPSHCAPARTRPKPTKHRRQPQTRRRERRRHGTASCNRHRQRGGDCGGGRAKRSKLCAEIYQPPAGTQPGTRKRHTDQTPASPERRRRPRRRNHDAPSRNRDHQRNGDSRRESPRTPCANGAKQRKTQPCRLPRRPPSTQCATQEQ